MRGIRLSPAPLILSRQRLCRNVADYPVVIPSEREGSKTDFSLSVETRISRGVCPERSRRARNDTSGQEIRYFRYYDTVSQGTG